VRPEAVQRDARDPPQALAQQIRERPAAGLDRLEAESLRVVDRDAEAEPGRVVILPGLEPTASSRSRYASAVTQGAPKWSIIGGSSCLRSSRRM
jgi:hypothetical protein